ncbi:hypothetical protein NX774_08130 [Massilia agilis]|uniref:DUF4240 domain-containing protein n=1 Tax=Massilia agilis TaxID=1811226 RepID=A0ABT2DAN4_9BURK|nr:hypothetical protein [Massilia agilis]MCS0807889.1 hypothetical protein [Massilia agilis]
MTLLAVAALVIMVFAYLKKSRRRVSAVSAPPDYAVQLSEWVELVNVAGEAWARGKRINWLPPEAFGDGACLLTGVIDLADADPALKAVIDRELSPVYFDATCVVARMLVAAGGDEHLILGSIDDLAVQEKLAALCAGDELAQAVCVQICSESISPVIAKDDRDKFERIWQQYG